jgi:hypothetical protein
MVQFRSLRAETQRQCRQLQYSASTYLVVLRFILPTRKNKPINFKNLPFEILQGENHPFAGSTVAANDTVQLSSSEISCISLLGDHGSPRCEVCWTMWLQIMKHITGKGVIMTGNSEFISRDLF